MKRTLRKHLAWTVAAGLLALLAVALVPAPDVPAPGRGGLRTAVAPHAATDASPLLATRGGEAAPAAGSSGADAAPGRATADGQDPALDADAFEHWRGGAPLTAQHPDVARVIAVQERHTLDLLRLPQVVGTATGLDARGNLAVIVLTRVPVTNLPRFVDGVPVEQFVSGDLIAARGKPGGTGGGGSSVDPTAAFARPVPIGVSTGHPLITAGTIGCRVTDGTDFFALSNNHVYARENLANSGDAVIQPGTYDGGHSPADDIGTLTAFVDLEFAPVSEGGANTMDAAIAKGNAGALAGSTPSDGYGSPLTQTVGAAIGLRVSKYGRTTGMTNGKVYAINAAVNVGYSGGSVAGFVGQVIITPGAFSGPGDSGSLIVGQKGGDARKPVALLFAGSSSVTIASPIDPILAEFGVTVSGD